MGIHSWVFKEFNVSLFSAVYLGWLLCPFACPPQPVKGFPGDSVVKKPSASVGDTGSIPGAGRSPGEVNGNPLQYSCLEKPMDREAHSPCGHRRVGHNLVTK